MECFITVILVHPVFLFFAVKKTFIVRTLIFAAINVILWVILYVSVRLCCKNCCSKKLQGFVLNVNDSNEEVVQPVTEN